MCQSAKGWAVESRGKQGKQTDELSFAEEVGEVRVGSLAGDYYYSYYPYYFVLYPYHFSYYNSYYYSYYSHSSLFLPPFSVASSGSSISHLRRPNPVKAVSAIPEFLSAYQATAAPQFRLPFLLQSPTILTILAALANQKPRIGHFVLGEDRLVNYELGLPRGKGMRNDAGLRGIARVGWGVTWREREEGEGEQ